MTLSSPPLSVKRPRKPLHQSSFENKASDSLISASSSMSNSTFKVAKECRYKLLCTNKECPYQHPKDWTPREECLYGAKCNKRKCPKIHECKFDRVCQRKNCKYRHPNGREIEEEGAVIVCIFGDRCDRTKCTHYHPEDDDSVISEPELDLAVDQDLGRRESTPEVSLPVNNNSAPAIDPTKHQPHVSASRPLQPVVPSPCAVEARRPVSRQFSTGSELEEFLEDEDLALKFDFSHIKKSVFTLIDELF